MPFCRLPLSRIASPNKVLVLLNRPQEVGKGRGFVIKGLKEGGRDEKAERVKIDGNGKTGQQH